MSRNTMYALVALLLVILIGGAGSFWAFKKYKQKQNQEYRYEGKLTLSKEGVDADMFEGAVLSGKTLDETIEKHDLVSRWELTDVEAAKTKIREKFIVKVNGFEVSLTYQDKDKELARQILKSLMDSFYAKEKAKAVSPPKM